MLERPERDDLLEEVESSIAGLGVREVGDGCRARPRDDRGEEDADEEGTLDTVEHQEDRENTAARVNSLSR